MAYGNEKKIIRSEVQYTDIFGQTVHSDTDFDFNTNEGMDFITAVFNEWLTNSDGTGFFYIGKAQSIEETE